MAKFKLIKKFPGSPEVGTIFTGGEGFYYRERGMDGKKPVSLSSRAYLEKDIENNPEYFARYLFTTTDKKDIYEGDVFYHIAYENVWLTMAIIQPDYQKYGKTFSTEKAAQDYMDSLKPQYKEGDYVLLSIGNSKYVGIYEGFDKESNHFIANEWICIEPGKALSDDVFISKGYFKKVERLMTQHEIFEYLMAKHNVRNEWPMGSKVELVDDELTLNLRGSRGVVKGYTVEKEHLHLYIEWTNSIYNEDVHIVDEENGIYPLEIFKLIK